MTLLGPTDSSAGPRAQVEKLCRWLQADDDQPWVISTSGSTGKPKKVVLSRDAVRASIDLSARRMGAAGPWLLALPAGYVAGVNVITRSLAAGHRPVLLDEHASLPDAVSALADGPRFVSLVPTQLLRYLESDADLAALRTFHTILIGGGPVDSSLRERASEAGLHVMATYGSAETCGGCVYDGVPFDGVGLAIGADGRVRISGPTLFDGYEDDPELTAEVLVDGWFLTSDAGRLDEDGHLQLLGRIDDMVVTGGVNVPAAVVARRLREHPAVREAEVLGVPDDEWGNRLVAYVVGSARLEELRDWVSETQPRSWAPRQLVVLDELPMLGNGKPDRLRLRGMAGA